MDVEKALDKVREILSSPATLKLAVREIIWRPKDDRPINKWSFLNQMIALCAGTQDARSYKAWRKVGRHVNAGARAFYILAPMIVTKIEGTPPREEKKLVGFRGQPEFRVEDTSGKAVNYNNAPPANLPPLLDVAEAYGVKVEWAGPVTENAYGFFRRSENRIVLFTDEAQVFLHELGHAVHKQIDSKYEERPTHYLEAVAELTALTLGTIYAPESVNVRFSYDYICRYAGEPVKVLASLFGMVTKVVSQIVEIHEAGSETAEEEEEGTGEAEAVA